MTTSVSSGSERYHALDRVRATAMLLGVLYHTLVFEMFFGGGPGMGSPGPARWVQDWLHSFRMPLFFIISGFFGRMMLQKYGTRGFLERRWNRIGLVLLVAMFTFSPLYIVTRDLLTGPMPGMGGGRSPVGPPPSFGEMPPPPAGFMPPPLRRFDTDGDGSFSDEEWKAARVELAKGGGPGGPGPGPGGPPGGPFGSPGGGVAGKLFGPMERYVQLHHLWFLWYLLVFVTIAPFLTAALGAFSRSSEPGGSPGVLVRFGLAPLILGLVSTPALLMCSNPFGGVGLGLAPAIFKAFPDFVLHPDPDMIFYFLSFLAGWWLHRERAGLPMVGRLWLPNLVLGLIGFGVATRLGDAADRRLIGTTAYCLGSAFTSFGFLGVFLHYLDQPSRTWRYLADTALWVYLIHQPLVIGFRALVGPLHLVWWIRAGVVSTSSVVFALMLYESIIRTTVLARLFGPSGARIARTTDED